MVVVISVMIVVGIVVMMMMMYDKGRSSNGTMVVIDMILGVDSRSKRLI